MQFRSITSIKINKGNVWINDSLINWNVKDFLFFLKIYFRKRKFLLTENKTTASHNVSSETQIKYNSTSEA